MEGREIMENGLRLLDFLPLIIFSYGARLFGLANTQQSWGPAFYIGATLALLQMGYYWQKGISLDYIGLGSNLFLIYGALGYALYEPLLIPYSLFKQASVFLWIGLVGSLATLIAPHGFIQTPNTSRKITIIGSMALLGAVTLALLASYMLVRYTIYTGIGVAVPFVLLLFIREVLRNYFASTVTMN